MGSPTWIPPPRARLLEMTVFLPQEIADRLPIPLVLVALKDRGKALDLVDIPGETRPEL